MHIKNHLDIGTIKVKNLIFNFLACKLGSHYISKEERNYELLSAARHIGNDACNRKKTHVDCRVGKTKQKNTISGGIFANQLTAIRIQQE